MTRVEHLFDDEVVGGSFRRLDVGESSFALATAQSEGKKREERIENLFHCVRYNYNNMEVAPERMSSATFE